MRSEAEIRKQVETRLHRRGLLVLDGGLWAASVLALWYYADRDQFSFGEPWASLIILFMLAWLVFVGLHTFRVLYIELREWLVRRAIDREMRDYFLRDTYEKRKRDDARLRLSDDGELGEWMSQDSEPQAKHE